MTNRKINKEEAEKLGLPLRFGDMVGDKMFIYYAINKKGKITTYCQSKEKHYARQRKVHKNLRQKKRAFIHRVKTMFGCKVCGYKKCANALHFNHIKPKDKEYNIAAMVGSCSINKIKKEIRKCEIMCSNCHAEHSYEEKHHMIGNDRVYKANAER